MHLLGSKQIVNYQLKGLEISTYENRILRPEWPELGQTWYYLRLGPKAAVWNSESKKHDDYNLLDHHNSLTLKPYEYAVVWSYEKFKCPHNIMGIFGHNSNLITEHGFALHCSPCIDPRFEGYLEIGLQNLRNENNTINYQDPIGKVIFFELEQEPEIDISDLERPSDWLRRKSGPYPLAGDEEIKPENSG